MAKWNINLKKLFQVLPTSQSPSDNDGSWLWWWWLSQMFWRYGRPSTISSICWWSVITYVRMIKTFWFIIMILRISTVIWGVEWSSSQFIQLLKPPKAPEPTAPPPFPHYVDFSPLPLLPGIWSSIFPHQTKSHTNPQPQTNITRSHRQRTEFDVWLKIRPLKPNWKHQNFLNWAFAYNMYFYQICPTVFLIKRLPGIVE